MRFPTRGLLPDPGILLPRRLTFVCKPLHIIHQNGSQQCRLSFKLKGGGRCPGAAPLDKPSGEDSLPSWRTVCVWHLQLQASSGSASAWSHSHAPLLMPPNQWPSKASKGLANPTHPRAPQGTLLGLHQCPVMPHPAPSLWLCNNYPQRTSSFLSLSFSISAPALRQPSQLGGCYQALCADWIVKNLGLKRTNGVTFDWPSKQRELQEGKWELGLWIGTCLEDRN